MTTCSGTSAAGGGSQPVCGNAPMAFSQARSPASLFRTPAARSFIRTYVSEQLELAVVFSPHRRPAWCRLSGRSVMFAPSDVGVHGYRVDGGHAWRQPVVEMDRSDVPFDQSVIHEHIHGRPRGARCAAGREDVECPVRGAGEALARMRMLSGHSDSPTEVTDIGVAFSRVPAEPAPPARTRILRSGRVEADPMRV